MLRMFQAVMPRPIAFYPCPKYGIGSRVPVSKFAHSVWAKCTLAHAQAAKHALKFSRLLAQSAVNLISFSHIDFASEIAM